MLLMMQAKVILASVQSGQAASITQVSEEEAL